jgi:hypothetical protein
MHRTDASGHSDNMFTNGNPASGTAATVVDAKWLNAVQEEIAGVVEDAGITLDDEDSGQLLQALDQKISAGGGVQKSFYIKGALSAATGLIKYLAGVGGNITEIAAAIDSGTSATVVIKNGGNTVATLTATQAGVLNTTPANTTVANLSKLSIDITAVDGDPMDLIGYIAITPGS